MPKFTVRYHYVVDHYGAVEVDAKDAGTAQERVLGENIRDEYEWSDTNVFEFLGVEETPPETEEEQLNGVS
jgi:hypothetical protein